MLVRVQIPYSIHTRVKALTREEYAVVREEIFYLNLSEWEDDKAEPPYSNMYGVEMVMDVDDLPLFEKHGFEMPAILHFKNGYWKNEQGKRDKNVTESHTHVTVTDVGLLQIDEVAYEEDCCTDRLQGRLDDGWRLLSVVPPFGTRRPTYILGRKKKDRS